ncbi:MAG: hypothetical protein ABEN55_13230, partial [Bradymonadaceae bacterium]
LGRIKPLARLAYDIQPAKSYLGNDRDDSLDYAVGARGIVMPGQLSGLVEVRGDYSFLADNAFAGHEVVAGVTAEIGNAGITLGGGPGFGRRLGTPAWRTFLDISYTPTGRQRDADQVPDSVDKCPDAAEDRDDYRDDDGCPDWDNDGDGINDSNDKCPGSAEDRDGYQDDDGCPDEDNDGDGIPDT